jgi:beta-galactosidase/beta-glucuronidase
MRATGPNYARVNEAVRSLAVAIMNSSRIIFFCLTAIAALHAASREIIPLSAGWNFQIDVSDIGEKERWYGNNFDRSAWAKVSVPKAWDLYDEALWGYEGVGWYSMRIDGALARKDSVQRLKFGRVNYHSKVWLNGELLGENVNGYLNRCFQRPGTKQLP